MKKSFKNKKQTGFQEPEVIYNQEKPANVPGTISFASAEEHEEERIRYQASLSPEELLQNLYQLICISYGLDTEALRNPKLGNRIIFENPDEHFS